MSTTALRDLTRILRGRVETDGQACDQCSRDFGGVIRRRPLAVAHPVNADDLISLVRWASDTRTPLAMRGAGHSQAGQTLVNSGVVVQLDHFREVGRIEPDGSLVEVAAGATWHDVVEKTKAFGLAPRVLTTEHSTTVGGTLSVGGYGSTSFRYGAQVNNIAYLDVVTGTGEFVRCSPEREQQLFAAARAGLGQFGAIVGAGLLLRPVKGRIRTLAFAYGAAMPFMEDLVALMTDGRATHLLAHFKDEGSPRRQTLRLTAGIEYDDVSEVDEGAFDNLQFERRLPTTDTALFGENHIFYFRYADWFGPPDQFVNPWVDHHLTLDDARRYFDAILHGRYAPMLQIGMSTVIPTAALVHEVPLAVRRANQPHEPLLGVGIFPRLPSELSDMAELSSSYDADVKREYRGRRYLYGYCDSSAVDWASEFGELWPWVREMKRRYDPRGVFNPELLGLRGD